MVEALARDSFEVTVAENEQPIEAFCSNRVGAENLLHAAHPEIW